MQFYSRRKAKFFLKHQLMHGIKISQEIKKKYLKTDTYFMTNITVPVV